MNGTRGVRFLSAAAVTVAFLCLGTPALMAQASSSEEVRVILPLPPQAAPPNTSLSAAELERRADDLRASKAYYDALDYYRAAIRKAPKNAALYNKAGICELQTQRYTEAAKDFARAIHADRNYADAYNNLGVVEYESKKYGKALSLYAHAISLQPDSASFHSNQGAAYFAKKEFDKANDSYMKALQMDPDIFERTSHNGVSARLPSPEDRAHYDYAIARLYARLNASDRSLEYLRRAMEEGYKGINDVYKDEEFSNLRKDPRFTELMKQRPVALPD
jgi:tetratricopeptide (TPR) repeat protein